MMAAGGAAATLQYASATFASFQAVGIGGVAGGAIGVVKEWFEKEK